MTTRFTIEVTMKVNPGQTIEPEAVHTEILRKLAGNTSLPQASWMKLAEIRVIPQIPTPTPNGN